MAQPSMLSDKGLARFRTKTCERILAGGICTFGSRCQYSHSAALPRRNPTKRTYVPELCPHVAAGAEGHGGGCARGELCGWAHYRALQDANVQLQQDLQIRDTDEEIKERKLFFPKLFKYIKTLKT